MEHNNSTSSKGYHAVFFMPALYFDIHKKNISFLLFMPAWVYIGNNFTKNTTTMAVAEVSEAICKPLKQIQQAAKQKEFFQ